MYRLVKVSPPENFPHQPHNKRKKHIMAEPTNVKVLRDYFGKKEGGTLAGFAAELKELTDQEKQQLADGIRNESLTY